VLGEISRCAGGGAYGISYIRLYKVIIYIIYIIYKYIYIIYKACPSESGTDKCMQRFI
jgi:hypothetical protein